MSMGLRLSVVRKLPPRPLRTEGQRETVRERHVRWRRVGGDANRNGLLRYVEPQRAVKVIPDGQTAGPVRIRFRRYDRMVNAVNTRRHDEASHEPLHVDRKFDIRVVKENREEDDVLPDQERVGRDADGRNLERAPW